MAVAYGERGRYASDPGASRSFALTAAPANVSMDAMSRVILLLLLTLVGCFRPRSEAQKPRCPDSDRAACTSGGEECKYDAKRSCDLCLCKHEVI